MRNATSIRFEAPSRQIYRFQIIKDIQFSPSRPGVYAVFIPRLPTERQDTPLLWGIADKSILDLAERHAGHVAKDPRVEEALRVKDSFFATLLVDGHAARRRIFDDLSKVKAVYDFIEDDAEEEAQERVLAYSRTAYIPRAAMSRGFQRRASA